MKLFFPCIYPHLFLHYWPTVNCMATHLNISSAYESSRERPVSFHDYSYHSLMPRNLREQVLLMRHLCAGSQQYSSVAGLCWCKCGPKAPCQQSLEAPNQVQTQDCCTSARIVARSKKSHKHWSSSR